MAAKPRKKAPHWMNQAQAAAFFEVSRKAFQEWGVKPVAKIGRYTYYTGRDVLAARLAHQVTRQQKADPATDAELTRAEREEKLRLTKAQAEGQEIKNAQQRRELAPILLIEYVIADAGRQISAILDALPMQIKKRNPKLTASDIEIIRREIAKALNVCAGITVDLDEYYERAVDEKPEPPTP